MVAVNHQIRTTIAAAPDLHERVFDLLRATATTGRHVFDLELAATMLASDVATIHTFDARFEAVWPTKAQGTRPPAGVTHVAPVRRRRPLTPGSASPAISPSQWHLL